MKDERTVVRVARALARAHDKLDASYPRKDSALLAYEAGSVAVWYWDTLARAALRARAAKEQGDDEG